MLGRLLIIVALFAATSNFAGEIDCVSTDVNQSIEIGLDSAHQLGWLKVDGRELSLMCESDNLLDLRCKAFLANSVYNVSIHRVIRNRRMEQYEGTVSRTIGGFAGPIRTDLGTIYCAELERNI